MSTISQQLPPPPPMPRHRMPEALSSQSLSSLSATTEVGTTDAADTVTSGDADSDADGSATQGASLDPAGLKDRIDDLLAQQVQSGTLTSAQADTLKSAFGTLETEPKVGGGRPQGPPPGPPPDAARAPSSGTTATDASTDDLLASFVKQLQSTQTRAAYGADGGHSGGQSASALLLNFRA